MIAWIPYAGGATPFSIGLRPISPEGWLEPENPPVIASKAAAAPWFLAEPATEAAQAEAARHLAEAAGLPGDSLEAVAGRLTEDAALMFRGEETWRLAVSAVAHPSNWAPAEKLGQELDVVHGDVPGFGRGARNAAVTTRIFDRLTWEQPLERFNWSIYPNADWGAARAGADVLQDPHVRVERQTLRRLPETGAVVFTIGLHITPLDLAPRPADLADALRALSAAQRAYKGLSDAQIAALASRLEQRHEKLDHRRAADRGA